MKEKVLFLDRDGVINENVKPAPMSWDSFTFLPGVKEALAEATQEGWRIIVATNKGVVGLRLLSKSRSKEINDHMLEELAAAGARIEAVYACEHFPHGLCHCRKPRPGMLDDAKRDLGLRPDIAWMVGDKPTDVLAGRRAGCKTVILTTSYDREALEGRFRVLKVQPDAWATGLDTAWRDVIGPSGRP